MEELALHILDIVQNSISAKASEIVLTVTYNEDFVTIVIKDNGQGMTGDYLNQITDPFTTSRTSRKVGLGIPLLKDSCEQSGGSLEIKSRVGEGTTLKATFQTASYNRPPLGNMGQTMSALICFNENISFAFSFKYGDEEYTISTNELKEVLGDVSLNNPEVAMFVEKDVNDGIKSICKEDII